MVTLCSLFTHRVTSVGFFNTKNLNNQRKEKTMTTNVPAAFSGTTSLAERKELVGAGSQNVTTADVAIPRLKLLADISDEVKKKHDNYIEGAEAGMILNSVTKELHTSIFLINLHFQKTFIIWKKRALGGGKIADFDTKEQCEAYMADNGLRPEDHDIAENPTHLVMLLDDEGEPKSVALLDMPSSKIKVSRRWNAMIQEQEREGNPRFGCVWQLCVVSESNAKGDFYNYDVKLVAHAPDDLYAYAEQQYLSMFDKGEAA